MARCHSLLRGRPPPTGSIRGLRRLYAEQRRSYPVKRLAYARNVVWRYGARPVLGSFIKKGLDRSFPSVVEQVRLWRLARSSPPSIAADPRLEAEVVRRERDLLEREAVQRAKSTRTSKHFPRFYIEQGRSALDHALMAMETEETFEQGRRLDVRFRAPYWDAELVAFLYRTPPELLNRGGWSKGLVRRLRRSPIPTFGFERQRKVSATSFARSEILSAAGLTRTTLGRRTALEEAGIVDGALMRANIETAIGGSQARRFSFVWDLLSLETWLKAHM